MEVICGNQINIFRLRYITPSDATRHLPPRGRQLKAPLREGGQPKAIGGSKRDMAKPRLKRVCGRKKN